MTLVAVHAALALLEVDRVVRQIPVVDTMAVGMEVEPFLPDRRGCQYERPERRVEGVAHAAEAGRCSLLVTVVGEAHGEAAAHREMVDMKLAIPDLRVVDIDLRRAKR